MNIMSTIPDESGRYEFQENWIGIVPSNFIEATINPDDFYAAYGFVTPIIKNGVVVSITPNDKAQMSWLFTRPEQIRADIDFIAAIQGVSL